MKIITTIKSALTRTIEAIRNAWKPAPSIASPDAAATSRINALLLHLCDYDQERALWVKRWLALPLHNPGTKMNTAIIVCSEQGTGASLFFEQVAARMHGQHGRVIPSALLNLSFNDWAAKEARLVIVDGAMERPQQMKHLKILVTDPDVVIHQKGMPSRQVPNQMNFVFVSGHRAPLSWKYDDRRFFVIETPQRLSPRFYGDVADEIRAGGVDAFMRHLVDEINMGQFNESTPMPQRTRAKAAA